MLSLSDGPDGPCVHCARPYQPTRAMARLANDKHCEDHDAHAQAFD